MSTLRVMKKLSSTWTQDSLYEFLLYLKEWEVRKFAFFWHSNKTPYVVELKFIDKLYSFHITFNNETIIEIKDYDKMKTKSDLEDKLKWALLSCWFTSYKESEIDKPVTSTSLNEKELEW